MEKVNILYSIIIPHYNIPELLQRCLNSIPDLPSFQVIIVDDCSDGKIVDFRYFPGMERENVKCIFDFGDWYHIVFKFPTKSIYCVCQKNLLEEGTIEEFETIFEGKIVRKK